MNMHVGPKLRSDPQTAPRDSEAPIRTILAPHGDLRQLGRQLALGTEAPLPDGFQPFLPRERTKENAAHIRAVIQTLDGAQQAGEQVTPAANWLLDNSHVVEEAIVGIRRDLPPRFYRQLPLMAGGDAPRVLAIAWAYVAQTDSAVSQTGFREIVEGFQEIQPLRIGELWALPSVLRFVLVENLRRLALRVARARDMRLAANEVADKLAAAPAGSEAEILSAHADHARERTFATQLLHRLRDGSQTSHAGLAWLEAQLEAAGTDAEEITAFEHANLSAGNVTTSNIVKGLRLLDDIDWTVWFEEVSGIDRLLRERTDFSSLDFPSRDAYRRAIEELAKRSGGEEHAVAQAAIDMAGNDDVGALLVGPRRREMERAVGYSPSLGEQLHRAVRKSGWVGVVVPVVLLAGLFVTAIFHALAATGIPDSALALLVVLFVAPALEAAVGLYNTAVSALVKPTRLIGYEFRDGVPSEARTFVVVPTLIGSRDDIEEAVRNLEVHYLANMTGALHFAILSDWPDSQVEETQADRDLLAHARAQVAALNARYAGHGQEGGHARFFLLHRRRLYNEAEGVWMGWERKRGKLHELNALLRGDSDTTFLAPADPLPGDVQYVLTLDADTRTMRDAAAKLAGKLAHPLNRPVIDAAGRRLISGFGILQPRVTPSLTTGDEASFFQRVFSANRGFDPYVFAVSDVYQDLFGEGTFTGKGLYHIDAMETALKDRLPENAVLSHDLLEGAYARAALVSDVELIEDYPTRYLVDASRHHRWARGDWQLLPWVLSPSSGVSGLSRWKMIDNLRRSLTPILWIAASVAGWTLLPFSYAAQWQAVLIVSLFLSLTFGLLDSLVPRDGRSTLSSHFAAFAHDFAFASAQVVAKVVLMAHNASSMGDAIVRTLYRLLVSRRHMLEWRTASAAARSNGRDLSSHYRTMAGVLPIAVVGVAIPFAAGSTGAYVAVLFGLLWAASPAFAWLISQSAETEDKIEVSAGDAAALRHIARRTWLYFETFVTVEHNMLPPDNFQEDPEPVVAARTSPTNIGVYLLSAVSARDFGWISLAETIERLEKTLSTMEKMERHRGHLYNWYETRTLNPLHPLYISSVDSGNLAGHLVAVAAACDDWAAAPAAHLQGDFEGILDTLAIVEEALQALPDDRRPLRPLRKRLFERADGLRRAVDTIRSEPETASIRAFNLTVQAADIRKLARALDEEISSTASGDIVLWAERLEKACEAHLADAHTEENGVGRLRKRLVSLRDRARKFAFEMDFAFLLRQDRKLLSIGYRAEEHQLDEACYDLLASEARLTSLFGVAKGDLPAEHWFRLGRPVTAIGFSGALMSWSGSMFEYLMPPLVMKEPRGGILDHTSHLVIRRQIAYGRQKGVPWGVSEAAYNARDREMTYQYTNFGVPGLGLKRGLGQDTVIAPYASLLAAQFRPADAVDNLERLKGLGALGRYGFHDAVDFTPARLPLGKTHAVVRNFMAHHHGMSIVAVANTVFEGRMRDRFHSDPVIVAAELLLQEKAPRTVPSMPIRADAGERVKPAFTDERPDSRLIDKPLAAPSAINVMSNGYYNVMVTATGAGYSRAGEIAVTRWSGDGTEERTGTFLFVTDTETGQWWSASAEPKRAPEEEAHAFFCDDKATFIKTVGSLSSEVECIVLSEGNGEARRITLWNESDRDRHVEVTSFAEIALAYETADVAHPAFAKMFVKTEIDVQSSTIFAERRRRSDDEPAIALAHFVTHGEGVSRGIEAETDRRAFIGRGRSLDDAAAFDRGARLSGAAGFTLDPVMALRAKVRVPARKKVSLTFWTVTAANRADVEEGMPHFLQPDSFERQAMLAWTRSQVQTRHVGLSLSQAAGVQKLARHLVLPGAALRAPDATIASSLGPQSSLWPTSISGDFPIFAVRIGDVADLEIVASVLRMQEYLRARGLLFDLVVINEQAASYVQDLQQAIERLCENARMHGRELGPRQHIFAVRRDLMDDATYGTLIGAARIVLHTRNGPILDQIERAEASAAAREVAPLPASVPAETSAAATPGQAEGSDLSFWNGFGGFSDEGRDYVVRLSGNRATPQPWINVIANENFGFHTSSEGSSFTWSRNSRDFQLTPWSNDPVVNRPGEGIYLHDRDTGAAFSPFACLLRDPALVYEARHERGASTFSVRRDGLTATVTQLVDPADPVKIQQLRLENTGGRTIRLRVYAYAEWVLGNNRPRNAPMIVPGHDAATGALLARNPYHLDFGDRTAFLACDGGDRSFTCDRSEFIGAGGSSAAPGAVIKGAPLAGACEPGRDPCAAISCDVEIAPGDSASIHFIAGDAGSTEEAAALAERHLSADFAARLTANRERWTGFSDALQVSTPDPAFDAMVNTWLPYQALACRVEARAAFYQASGAYGFRDQLQDTLALIGHDPSLARAQILNAAGRQFPEGDVQHWWLPRSGAGVRTMISDDVVWLGYAAHLYVRTTGDRAILDEPVPFIEGPALAPGEHDAFFTPENSRQIAPLYEHCARALDLAMRRTGENGLPLILGGDWNDGMNRVGEAGRGTSVWLGWFLAKTLRDFAALAAERGDDARAEAWLAHADRLKQALETAGWDGEWYRRGTFDDGEPLGSARSDECRIDSIAQSWAVLSGVGDRERANAAVSKALDLLVDDEAGIARLFTPPFEHSAREPGYIKSYPPGVRENGGQYTHAATWLIAALAELGRADDAWRLFSMVNPVNHALTEEAAGHYRVEPFVVAADVYGDGDKTGRGGWTWYTGSAGWLYRVAVENILGIRREGDRLHLKPALPAAWPGFTARLRIGEATYGISIRRGPSPSITVDGKAAGGDFVRLHNEGEHEVDVTVA